MENSNHQVRLDSRRILLIIAGTLLCGGSQGVLLNTLGIFVKPVTQALGFSRGSFLVYFTITSILNMITLPFYGELYKKPWITKFMVLSAVMCAVVPLGYSFCTSLWQFYALSFLLGVFFHGVSIPAVGNILNYWFGRNRGLAYGIAFSGSGIFAAVMIAVANTVIVHYGWQWGYRSISFAGMALMVIGMFLIYRIDAKRSELHEDDPEFCMTESAGRSPVQLTRGEALKTPVFYGLIVAGFILSFTVQCGASNIVAYLSDVGYGVAFQSAVISFSMLGLAAAKIVVGKILDRFGARTGITVCCSALFLFSFSLIFIQWPLSPYLYIFGYAFAASGGSVSMSYLIPLFFGQKDFARIYVLIYVALNLGTALGASYPSMVYDRYGTYLPAWYLVLVFTAVMAVAFTLAYRDHMRRVQKLEVR